MPGDNPNKNLDSYLDEKLRSALSTHASQDFTFELMKRVDLEKEFAKEDIKTSRIARFSIGSLIAVLCGLVVMFTVSLNSNPQSKDVSFFNGLIDRFSYMIESTSIVITETFGFAINFQTGIIILVVMAFIFLFSFADKAIFKRSYK